MSLVRSGIGSTASERGAVSRAVAMALLIASLVAVLILPGTVGAQDDDAAPSVPLSVESVDARGDTWSIKGISPGGDPTVAVDGNELAAGAAGTTTDLVIVIDNDRSLPNGNLQLSSGAATALVPGAGPIGRVAVVSTARLGAQQELGLSGNPAAVTSTLERITPDGDSALWDALTRAAGLLESSDAPMKRVVAYVGSPDELSTSSPGEAETALRLADAQLDVIAVPTATGAGRLGEIIGGTGGSLTTIDSDDLYVKATTAEMARLDQQFKVDFASLGGDEAIEFTVAAPESDQSAVVRAEPGAVTTGSRALSSAATGQGLLGSLLSNGLVRWFAIALLAAAVIGFFWSLLNMVLPDSDSLENRLQVYEEGVEPGIDEGAGGGGMLSVPILQRAVDITGEIAEKRGFLEAIELSLERASMPLRAAEAMFFVAALAFLVGVGGFVVTGNLLIGLVLVVFALLIPKAVLDNKVRRRQKKFVALLPDMLALLAGTLKAGYSITQGFEAVSKEVDDPMGVELRRVVTEHRLGRTLEDALDATAERMGSDDFAWTVMAIKIQREVGGNLAELLLTVADTMTQRERLRRDVNSLTAEGRISAMILGMLPPGLAVVMYFMNRDYILQLFTPGLGYVMIGAAVIAMFIGFMWMKKIITIEV
ncbi:MAG: type II secretion system F family protein [Microthrixaceae bacterium]